MKPRQVLGKYFEVYGQLSPITPEAGKKGAPFFLNFCEILMFCRKSLYLSLKSHPVYVEETHMQLSLVRVCVVS